MHLVISVFLFLKIKKMWINYHIILSITQHI